MTPMEAEAMLIRHSAAMRVVGTCDEQERWSLLAAIVSPSLDALEASMERAEQLGPSKLAEMVARTYRSERVRARKNARTNLNEQIRAGVL